MRAETMFKQYPNMKKELSVLEYQLGQFKGIDKEDLISSMCFSHPQGERVQTCALSDKTVKVAINYKHVAERMNDDWFDFLWNKHKELIEEIGFFEYSVKELGSNLSDIISDMLVEGMQWEELMNKYHVSHSMIAKYRKKAIKELDKVYELRDLQTEAYILS